MDHLEEDSSLFDGALKRGIFALIIGREHLHVSFRSCFIRSTSE